MQLPSKRNRFNLLISFAYIRQRGYVREVIKAIAPYCNILIDSGAHTNRNIKIRRSIGRQQSEPVSLKEYTDFLKEFHDIVWQYIALDVIRNKKETDRNLSIMSSIGYAPMPVFIEGYTSRDLQRIMKVNTRLCVAGAVGSSDRYIEERYKSVFSMSGGAAKIHGLGYGRYPKKLSMPFYSADSSSYNSGARYGIIFRYIKGLKIDSLSWQLLTDGGDKSLLKRLDYMQYLSSNGVDFGSSFKRDWFKGENNSASIPSMFGYFAYLQMMNECSEVGKDYFIACVMTDFILGLCCVIASERDDLKTFDYLMARDLFLKYSKNDDMALQFMVDTLKRTRWQQLDHSK